MRNLLLSLACVAAGCTASRAAAVAVPPAVCIDEDAPARAPVDPLTQSYQTAYSVCHSDPAFAASLYQQVVDRADPQSDLYSRASLRLDALQSALADRGHPEAARQACDQAAKWARPTERIAAPAPDAPSFAATPAAQAPAIAVGPLPASWLPAAPTTAAETANAALGSARTGCSSSATVLSARLVGSSAVAAVSRGGACPAVCASSAPGPASVSARAAGGAWVAPSCGSAKGADLGGALAVGGATSTPAPASIDLACGVGGAAAAGVAGVAAAGLEVELTSPGAPAGEWTSFAPGCSSRGPVEISAEPELIPPPLVAVSEPPLPAPPLVAVAMPASSPPAMGVGLRAAPQYVPSRPPVRIVVSGRDPGAELVGAFLSVFGRPVVRVYPPPPRRPH